jgi:iron complex outermembrane receptor protein
MIGKTRRWAGMGAAPMLASALALAVAGLVPQVAHAAPDGESADADGNRPIRVIGHPDPEGLLPDTAAPKAVSAIGAAFIEKQAATFNAYQLVNILPGANVASTDPFGLSTSSSLTLRGLGQDAIGVTMEGAPQNDIGYYVAYPAQFADPENIARVELSQGSADIASPVVNAVGGLLALSLDAPHRDFGVLADASLGSFNERRVFVRVDSGNLGRARCAPSCPIPTTAPTTGAAPAWTSASISTPRSWANGATATPRALRSRTTMPAIPPI